MTRVGAIGFAVALAGFAGCDQSTSPWARENQKPPANAAESPAASEAAEAAPSTTEPGVKPEDKPDPLSAETDARIEAFLKALSDRSSTVPDGVVEADPPQETGTTKRAAAYEPTVPVGATAPHPRRTVEAPRATPGINRPIDLANEPPPEGEKSDGEAEADAPTDKNDDVQPVKPAKPKVVRLTVRTGGASGDAVTEAPETLGVNEPLSPSRGPVEAGLESAIEELRARVSETPNDVELVWQLVMLLMATGEHFAVEPLLSEISQDDATVIRNAIEALRRIRDASRDPALTTDGALQAINRLRRRLARDAELQLPTVALCKRVSTFGVYEELDASKLQPYQANRVIVYCEVRNFFSRREAEGNYKVTLSSRLEILTPDGRSLWTHEEPDITDISRQQREDFFLAQLVTFPPILGPGEYVLKVMIEDTTAMKAAEAVHSFRVGEPAAQGSSHQDVAMKGGVSSRQK